MKASDYIKENMMEKKNSFNRLCISLIALHSYSYAGIIQINTEEDFTTHVLQNKKPVLVQYAADWCGVCQGVKQPFEQVSNEPEFSQITFARVNIDTSGPIQQKNNIVGIPTFIYMKNGEQIGQEVGVQNMQVFPEELRNNLRMTFKLAQNDQVSVTLENQSTDLRETNTQIIEETTAEEQMNFMDKVKAFFNNIIAGISNFFGTIFNKIKNLFSK